MSRVFNVTNLKKTWYYLRRNGMRAALMAAKERTRAAYFADYDYQEETQEELDRQRKKAWDNPVTFSILVPAYETPKAFLGQLIDSLKAQTYPYWELVLADGSTLDSVKETAEDYREERIHYIRLKHNGGISENSNAALKEVKGDYVGLLDHDDVLTPDALFRMAEALEKGRKENREYALLYSDEDKCDEEGSRFYDPHFKMDFNLDLFLTHNYICHFLVMKRELIQQLEFRKAFDGAQDYDLCLRAVSCLMKQNPRVEEVICHVPRVLYHWRCHEASTAANPQSKKYAYEAGKRALEDFLRQQGWKGSVKHLAHVGFYGIDYVGGIFAQRPDVAAVGGRLLKKGRIAGTAFDAKGEILYEGLPAGYSGYMHRAVLSQNVFGLDREYWEINPKLRKKVETFWQDIASKEGEDEFACQQRLCQTLLAHGYRLYLDPRWVIKK